MIQVFVDESGNLGTKDRFFVIALIVLTNPKRIKNIIKHHCAAYGHEESKAFALTIPMKHALLQKLCQVNDYEISYIVADKECFTDQKLFLDKNLLFNYLFQLLIKSIIESIDEDIEILLDNRDVKLKSVNSLADYIKIKSYSEWGFSHDISVEYTDSRRSKEVQMADLIANTVYAYHVRGNDFLYNMLEIKHLIEFPSDSQDK